MHDTTDPSLRSFLDVAPESHFPIQNLPYGVFIPDAGAPPRVGVALGDWVVDLSVLEERGLLNTPALRGRRVFREPALNAFMALGPAAWREAREAISRLLRSDVAELRDDGALRDLVLSPRSEVELCLPCDIRNYTDFYCCPQHAQNVGRIFRGPDAALPPHFYHMPIAYHGRASSLVRSGTAIHRPAGQRRGAPGPVFGPTQELDFELELGALVGRGNELGRSVSVTRARNFLFGLVLVNDWSARDIQQWEYQPLGPFNGKNFATTVSPWVVPIAALAPFRRTAPLQAPAPPAYLQEKTRTALDITLEVALQEAQAARPVVISRTNARHLHWSFEQMVAHHTIGGCNLQTGDLLASGTISGDEPDSAGSLLELARRGERPVMLPDGTQRCFLADGDAVTLSGWCDGGDYRVGFGTCRGTVVATAAAVS